MNLVGPGLSSLHSTLRWRINLFVCLGRNKKMKQGYKITQTNKSQGYMNPELFGQFMEATRQGGQALLSGIFERYHQP